MEGRTPSVYHARPLMNYTSSVKRCAIALACVVLVGCNDVLTTTQLDPVQDDRILGTWVDPNEPDDIGTIERNGVGYRARSADTAKDEEPISFTIARAGQQLFVQSEEKCVGHAFAHPNDNRQCYRISRIDIRPNELAFSEIDLDYFLKQSEHGKLAIEHFVARRVDKEGESTTCVLLEGTPAELSAFLAAYPSDGFKSSSRLRRKN